MILLILFVGISSRRILYYRLDISEINFVEAAKMLLTRLRISVRYELRNHVLNWSGTTSILIKHINSNNNSITQLLSYHVIDVR